MAEDDLLRRAAERAAGRPFFLGSALSRFASAEGLDARGLAEYLGCRVDDLPALQLCRRPGGEGTVFKRDVERIADRFGISATRLAETLRAAEALEAMAEAPPEPEADFLLAARDRDADEEPDG